MDASSNTLTFSSDPTVRFLKGLLNKKPSERLGWPELLDHPFVRETSEERLVREKALVDAMEVADYSRAWKGEGGAMAGAVLAAGGGSGGGAEVHGLGGAMMSQVHRTQTPPMQVAQTPQVIQVISIK